jgi:uncharacterized protein YndB with AHSA1/START domain
MCPNVTFAGMAEIVIEAEVPARVETVFDTIVDLRGYGRWLEPSADYPGTTEISADPIAAGTTYVESSPSGVRHGTVTEFDRPTRVTFHQPMTMKPRLLGVIDIHVTYTLNPAASGVHLTRLVTLAIGWPLVLVRPLVLRRFRRESRRTVDALVAYARAAS